jgi:hypothetical protein
MHQQWVESGGDDAASHSRSNTCPDKATKSRVPTVRGAPHNCKIPAGAPRIALDANSWQNQVRPWQMRAHFLHLLGVEGAQRAALPSSALFLRPLRQEFQLQERFKFAHEAAHWKDGVPRPPKARRHFVHVSAVWEKLQRPRELQVARGQTQHRHAWRLQVS